MLLLALFLAARDEVDERGATWSGQIFLMLLLLLRSVAGEWGFFYTELMGCRVVGEMIYRERDMLDFVSSFSGMLRLVSFLSLLLSSLVVVSGRLPARLAMTTNRVAVALHCRHVD